MLLCCCVVVLLCCCVVVWMWKVAMYLKSVSNMLGRCVGSECVCLVCSVYSIVRVPVEQERPYKHDSTASRLLSEVKHVLARLVLRWGTTLESRVLFFCSFDITYYFATKTQILLAKTVTDMRLNWFFDESV